MQEHHLSKFANQPFSIVCNSIDGSGGGKNSLDYTFNFGEKFQGKYELTFSFVSDYSTLILRPLLLNISWLNGNNFEGNQQNNQSVSNVVGILQFNDTTEDYLHASVLDNPPVNITLAGKNQFNISLLNFDKTLWSVADVNYVCVLHFK